jgi:glucosamine--fructose-6-phosphate aminotransferase (isomerizing)
LMCGLFGYAGPHPADPEKIVQIARLAATRGPHSHGYVTATGDTMISVRGEGDLRHAVPDLEILETQAIIGHSRLATTGTYAGGAPAIEDTMPFTVGEVAIVHNGNVRNHLNIATRRRYNLTTGCDSEVIAHLVNDYLEKGSGWAPLSTALQLAVEVFDDSRPFVVIAMNMKGEVAAIRRELPLYMATTEEGLYLCSREPKIPQTKKLKEMLAFGYPTLMVKA